MKFENQQNATETKQEMSGANGHTEGGANGLTLQERVRAALHVKGDKMNMLVAGSEVAHAKLSEKHKEGGSFGNSDAHTVLTKDLEKAGQSLAFQRGVSSTLETIKANLGTISEAEQTQLHTALEGENVSALQEMAAQMSQRGDEQKTALKFESAKLKDFQEWKNQEKINVYHEQTAGTAVELANKEEANSFQFVDRAKDILARVAEAEKSFIGGKSKAEKVLNAGIQELALLGEAQNENRGHIESYSENMRQRGDLVRKPLHDKMEADFNSKKLTEEDYATLKQGLADGMSRTDKKYEPGVVVAEARKKAGVDDVMRQLQAAAERLGVEIG